MKRLVALALILWASGTSGVSSQTLPDRVLIGYWHNWGWSPNNLTLAQIPPEYDVINIAFATPTTAFGATMSFAPDPSLYPVAQNFTTDVQALQAQGKKVLISIGGANGPVHLNNAGDIQSFVSSMLQIINTHNFDGLDIDLESGSLSLQAGDTNFANPTTPRIVNFITAMNQLMGLVPPGFMLTAAPETALLQGGYTAYAGVWGAYVAVIHALRNHLDFVHVQHYNTGTMYGLDGQLYSPGTADFHVAMADMLISGFPVAGSGTFPPLAAHQVAIGLPASTSAAGSGYTGPTVIHDALDRLILGLPYGGSYTLANPAGYPGFRGLMTWSINWDVDAGGQFSGSHGPYLDQVHLGTDTGTVSWTGGGSVNFTLRAGLGHPGRGYFLIPTMSGTNPGTLLPGGLVLPINLDALFTWAFSPVGAPFFPGFSGTLDGQGNASAQLVVPAVAGAAGITTSFAFVLPFPFDFVSPAVQVELVP